MFKGNEGYNGRKSQKIGKSLSMFGLHWLHLQELMVDLLFLKPPRSQRPCCLHDGGRAQALLHPRRRDPSTLEKWVMAGRRRAGALCHVESKSLEGRTNRLSSHLRVHLMGSHSQIRTAAEGRGGCQRWGQGGTLGEGAQRHEPPGLRQVSPGMSLGDHTVTRTVTVVSKTAQEFGTC